jgi:hypothetical protein
VFNRYDIEGAHAIPKKMPMAVVYEMPFAPVWKYSSVLKADHPINGKYGVLQLMAISQICR